MPSGKKSDIQHISRILSGNGAFIESKRGVGYRLFITNSVLFNQFTKQIKDTSFKNIPTSKQERSIYIIQRLLTLNKPILINDLADEIYVSRQTILNELKNIKIILNNYSLDLKSSNEGIFIYGDEIQKRRCLNEFFFQIKNNTKFSSLSTEYSITNLSDESIYIRDELVKVLQENKVVFSGQSINNMVIHILIAINRLKLGHFVSVNRSTKNFIHDTIAYKVALQLSKVIEKHYLVTYINDEIEYLAMHIHSKAITFEKQIDYDEVNLLLNAIFTRICNRFGLDFFANEELNKLLKLHIPAMVFRVRQKLYMRNSMAYKIMRHYQYAVEVCLEAVDEIEKWYGILLDENEFAYLVLYFNLAIIKAVPETKKRILVICSQGRPVLIMLLNKLNEVFGEQIRNIKVITESELADFDIGIHDILISTDKLTLNEDIPYIYVQDRIDDHLKEIYKALFTLNYRVIDFKQYLLDISHSSSIKCKTKMNVVHFLHCKLYKDLEKEEADKVIENIYPAFSEVDKNTVILHSLYDTKKPIIKFIHLRNEIIWNRTYVKYIIFCSCNTLSYSLVNAIYHQLSLWSNQDSKYLKDYNSLIHKLETLSS